MRIRVTHGEKTMKNRRLRAGLLVLSLVSAAAVGAAAYRYATAPVPGAAAGRPASEAASPARDRLVERQVAARDLTVDLLLDRWAGHVERVYGTAPAAWKRAMRPSLARLGERELGPALAATSFDAMMAALVLQPTSAVSSRGVGLEGAKTVPAGDGAYNVLTPCRLVDTRNTASRIDAGSILDIHVSGAEYGAQGGAASDCGVPADAKAVVVNVTVVQPDAPGYLSVFPRGAAMPLASSLNYTAGAIAGNEIIVGQAAGGGPAVSIYSYARTDVVVDVVGFFGNPPAKSLSCQKVVWVSTLPHAHYGSPSAECPFNYTLYRYSAAVGGSCRWLDQAPGTPPPGQLSGAVYSGYRYSCEGDNFSGVNQRIETTAICCNVVPL